MNQLYLQMKNNLICYFLRTLVNKKHHNFNFTINIFNRNFTWLCKQTRFAARSILVQLGLRLSVFGRTHSEDEIECSNKTRSGNNPRNIDPK